MNIYENRRRWLAHWIEKKYGGDRKVAGDATGYSRSQLSQFLSPKYQDGKSIQERAARKLEKSFGEPERIMESPAPGTSGERVPGQLYDQDKARQKIVAAIEKKLAAEGELPSYVQDAMDAILYAYSINMPREVFDAIKMLLNIRNKIVHSGTLPVQEQDLAKRALSTMETLRADIERATREAESSLASGGEHVRESHPATGHRTKGTRH